MGWEKDGPRLYPAQELAKQPVLAAELVRKDQEQQVSFKMHRSQDGSKVTVVKS
jgi:hypothetical protein